MATPSKPVFSVSVRELVEFALRQGDLGGEKVFVGSGRALAGICGHQRVQSSRPTGYRKELSVSRDIEAPDLVLRIQGRIDGLLVTSTETLLEEIKTVGNGWDGKADPLHWAQAKVYGFIYAQSVELERIALGLTYLDLESGKETAFKEGLSRDELARFFDQATGIYLEWVRERHRWCEQRNQTIRELNFPFQAYRAGQRELAVAAYRTCAKGGRLFLEAPTGIGKTMAVLYPALKAMAEGKLERIFYLTARTVGRAVAEKALAELRQAGLRLRAVTLTAKEKVCVREGIRCDPATCPLAVGYYDRRHAAMRDALSQESLTRPVLEGVGEKHQVCPFELSLDLSSWVDTVVCDYNYVFDPKVYLRRHFDEPRQDYCFLVDEAHNLPDRAREIFSAELSSDDVRLVQRAIKPVIPGCARALGRLATTLRKMGRASGSEPLETRPADGELDLFKPAVSASAPSDYRRLSVDHQGTLVTRDLPTDLLPALDEAMKKAEVWLAQNQPAEFREPLLELYFRLHSFRRTAELYDERYVTLIEPGASTRVRLYCVDPSFLLRQALERGKAAVFFSATLTPIDYYRSLMGGETADPLLQLSSPFPAENLGLLVHDRIRTQFKARAGTLDDVAQAIGELIVGQRGNYLVYFPSYQYLGDVQARFQAQYPPVKVLAQRPGMSEAERENFLAAFYCEHEETLVGFAVMGGIFGEGIDLVGERLIGAVIVGVGLPQLCVERDVIRDYFQEKNGAGFDYAYTFPGMNRVLQAIGRVIRSETDRGVALLIDTRFAEPRYRRLFPAWWRPVRVRNAGDIRAAVRVFWQAAAATTLPHASTTPEPPK